MNPDEAHLDGNAAAGVLQALFAFEITTAGVICAGCGRPSLVGQLLMYGPEPGIVLRCPACERVLLRLVHGGDRYWLDLHGIRSLEVPATQDQRSTLDLSRSRSPS